MNYPIKHIQQITSAKINTTRQGVDISVRNHRGLLFWQDEGTSSFLRFASVMALLIPALVGLTQLPSCSDAEYIFWGILIGGCAIVPGTVLYGFLVQETLSITKEKIIITRSLLGINMGKKHYKIDTIKYVRLAPENPALKNRKSQNGATTHVVLDVETPTRMQTIPCFQGIQTIGWRGIEIKIGGTNSGNIDVADAHILVKHVSEILEFRCHSVERIIFGPPLLSSDASYTTLYNPDVSTLTFPFVQLKQLVIDVKSYDIHHVERFLTYAVNYIGQEYLKEHVDVYLYGDPEKFHSNLHNSLTNLGTRIIVHDDK